MSCQSNTIEFALELTFEYIFTSYYIIILRYVMICVDVNVEINVENRNDKNEMFMRYFGDK